MTGMVVESSSTKFGSHGKCWSNTEASHDELSLSLTFPTYMEVEGDGAVMGTRLTSMHIDGT